MRKKVGERDIIREIDVYNAGWGVSNQDLKRYFFIIISGNMDFGNTGIGTYSIFVELITSSMEEHRHGRSHLLVLAG